MAGPLPAFVETFAAAFVENGATSITSPTKCPEGVRLRNRREKEAPNIASKDATGCQGRPAVPASFSLRFVEMARFD
jgi:hypothetical protein